MKDSEFLSRFSGVLCSVDKDGFVLSITLAEGEITEEAMTIAAGLNRLRSMAFRGDVDPVLIVLLQRSASLRW